MEKSRWSMYRKRLLILTVILLLLTGCTKITNNIDTIINAIMVNKNNYVNTVSTGYELYIPTGVKQVVDNQFNQTLCFIATYAFYDQPSIIDEFRWFRREYLLETKLGRRLNSLYVKISYPLTKSIQKNNFLRYCFKFILYFPLFVVRLLKCFSRNKL